MTSPKGYIYLSKRLQTSGSLAEWEDFKHRVHLKEVRPEIELFQYNTVWYVNTLKAISKQSADTEPLKIVKSESRYIEEYHFVEIKGHFL